MSQEEFPVFEEEEPSFEAALFADVEFVENPEPRCPCVLVLDASVSMQGKKIKKLQEAVERFKDELLADELAAKRVEVGVVAYGPTRIEAHFQTPEFFTPPKLVADGGKPMGEALELAVQLVEDRKETYKEAGVQYYRPWVILITDGAPDDDWEASAELIRGLEADGSLAFHAIGVEGADMETLALLSSREPLRLDGLRFGDLFSWLCRSLQAVSCSSVGQEVELPSVASWAVVG